LVNVHDRIRQLIAESGGRVAIDRVVRDAMGVSGARGPLARKLVEASLREARGLVVDGSDVVERATPGGRISVLALAPAPSSTALPTTAAWMDVSDGASRPEVVSLAGAGWREGVIRLARDLAGAEVHALSAATARRVLRLGERLARVDPDEEIEIVAIGQVARAMSRPLRGAEDAAALVGSPAPESPEQAAILLARLVDKLAEMAGVDVGGLRDLAARDVAAGFDFGDRAFGRSEVVALPEAPGVYLFEDAAGEVAYVGKAQNLRRRVGTYFATDVDERDGRIRETAHDLSHERTGTELSALLREQQLIRELRPALNIQAGVHARQRSSVAHVAERGAVAVVQASARGGAEIVLLDRARGVQLVEVVPDADPDESGRAILEAISSLRSRMSATDEIADVEIALTWLADRGASASVVDATGEPAEVAAMLGRLARDPDLEEGRIVVA
jgi:hypothetical protein